MIKINFCDFWPGFESNNLFLSFLIKHFNVIIDDKPDYLIFSVYGKKHLKYDRSIKIFYSGENFIPDFNLCDYALGFHYLDFGDRYLRFPLYVYYQWYYRNISQEFSLEHREWPDEERLVKRDFCNFVYSNNVNADPIRDEFFKELSKYKKVDSGGRHLNNISGPVKDKLNFIKDYKFTIAFENSSSPGYTTEKLLEPFLAKSLPIYFGNPLIHMEFQNGSIVHVTDRNDFPRAIDEIIHLDQNDRHYLDKIKHPVLTDENCLVNWEGKLFTFFDSIFSQPYNVAFRRTKYGFNSQYLDEICKATKLLVTKTRQDQLKSRIKSVLIRNKQ